MENNAATNFNWSCKHTWKRSAKNTGWCLLGCAIGDFGTILFFQLTQIPFPILGIMVLAIINGLITSIILETIVLTKQNLDFSKEASIMAMTPQYFFGTSYRFDSHFSIIAGINLLDSFTLGYTYESIVSSLKPTIKNSHGIFLKLNFGTLDPVNVNLVSPRF